MVAALAFYVFAAITIASAVMVVVAKNPVHAVLFLILAFFNAAGLFVLLGAEFVAMILVIVYVGAVAVLFLFVVMMLDVDVAELRSGFLNYLPIGSVIGAILLIELALVIGTMTISPQALSMVQQPAPDAEVMHNTRALGNLLYTQYIYVFQLAGLILLVAMIGAIVLTLRQRPGVRRQRVDQQIGRKRSEAVAIRKVDSGAGG